jgi:hypothetical protein
MLQFVPFSLGSWITVCTLEWLGMRGTRESLTEQASQPALGLLPT